ncbi:MAG TPA: shikimate dehydrogenase [Burkholderiales bacterium]|nr:shikimate dehydrogenase [Burkholderiales bacterium]
MTDRYAVVGHPVAHSLSPEIHAAFARQTGHNLEYARLLAPLNGFATTVDEFRASGGCGVNVTVPFKFDAFKYCEPAASALAAEAANTLDFRAGTIRGYNTDGSGLITDLEHNLGFTICGQRVLVMGAGGATYGVLHPLLEAQSKLLVVANRTIDKAVALVERARQKFPGHDLAAKPYDALDGAQFDLVINATSAGLRDEMPPLPPSVFAPGALAYDMVYARQTPFMTFAKRHGARTADGLGMLVEQAAEAFLIWRGVRPATHAVIAAMRERT